MQPHIYIAIPILAELENIEKIIQLFDDSARAFYAHTRAHLHSDAHSEDPFCVQTHGRASRENSPSASRENSPSASHENSPSASHENFPSASHENFPSASHENFPRASLENPQSASLWLCINNPDSWHDNPSHADEIQQNHDTLKYLASLNRTDINVIDRSSPGLGWTGKKQGVGMARKTLMDAIAATAKPNDIIISMDADTDYDADYLSVVVQRFQEVPEALGLAVPYYHPLPEDDAAARAMLRYEIYMRYYALNMYSRNIPYARTALGSAIALRVSAYKRVGGITPHAGGEDFYLLQKLAKSGLVLDYCNAVVRPSGRFSSRVPIGTGPAMIKGATGDWSGYPFYPAHLFDEVQQTFTLFPALYSKDVETPMSPFLRATFRTEDLWGPLRKNFKTQAQFIRACHEKVDGLRIRQYMRQRYLEDPAYDLTVLNTFLREKYATFVPETGFSDTAIAELNAIRDILFEAEQQARNTHDENCTL